MISLSIFNFYHHFSITFYYCCVNHNSRKICTRRCHIQYNSIGIRKCRASTLRRTRIMGRSQCILRMFFRKTTSNPGIYQKQCIYTTDHCVLIKFIVNSTHYDFLQVCCWCIGEYGTSLLDGCSIKQITDSDEGKQPTTPVIVTEDEVASIYQQILWDNHISVVTKQVIVFDNCFCR